MAQRKVNLKTITIESEFSFLNILGQIVMNGATPGMNGTQCAT